MSRNTKEDDASGSEQSDRAAPIATETDVSTATRKKPPSPRRCRDFIRRETANAMPAIVTKFVDKAKDGSVPHFSALTKVGGLDQRSGSTEAPKRRRKSLARQLLDEVEKYEAKQAAELEAADALTSPIENRTEHPGPQERS